MRISDWSSDVCSSDLYDDMIGSAALSALLRVFSFPFTDWENLTGQFAAIVHKGGRTYAFTDFFGAFQLFHDPDWDVVSTSFLAAVKSLERISFDPQGVYRAEERRAGKEGVTTG